MKPELNPIRPGQGKYDGKGAALAPYVGDKDFTKPQMPRPQTGDAFNRDITDQMRGKEGAYNSGGYDPRTCQTPGDYAGQPTGQPLNGLNITYLVNPETGAYAISMTVPDSKEGLQAVGQMFQALVQYGAMMSQALMSQQYKAGGQYKNPGADKGLGSHRQKGRQMPLYNQN